jgi:hypothetical protein
MYENLKRKYNDNEIYMLGALDCFGVPHTKDNINMKSYIDMISDELVNNGLNINYVNMHSLGCNKTWWLKQIIDKDYQKQEYYDLNLLETKKAIEIPGVFPFPINENFLEKYYINTPNPNLKITSHYVDSKSPLFFYSCGQMNMHYYLKMRSNDILKISEQLLFHFNENLDKTLNDIKNMVDYLIELNPTVTIFMFGVYPMLMTSLGRKALAPIYYEVNKKVKDLCNCYENIIYVDVLDNINFIAKDDCHPNYLGQCNMKNKVLTLLEKNTK